MSTAVSPVELPRATQWQRVAELVRIAALRSLKVRYRGSALGVLWSFGKPLVLTVMYTVVFGTAFTRYFDGSLTRYLMYVFVGLVAVTFFLNAVSEGLVAVVDNGALLNKIALPPAVFPLASVAANLFQQLLTTFPVVLILSIAITRDPVRVLLVPVVFVGLTLLTAGFALALSALNVFFRDLKHVWDIGGFMLWMTSPLFYPEAIATARVQVWFHVNPVGQQLEALREVTIGHGPLHYGLIAAAFTSGAVACALGAWLFRVLRRDFMDLV